MPPTAVRVHQMARVHDGPRPGDPDHNRSDAASATRAALPTTWMRARLSRHDLTLTRWTNTWVLTGEETFSCNNSSYYNRTIRIEVRCMRYYMRTGRSWSLSDVVLCLMGMVTEDEGQARLFKQPPSEESGPPRAAVRPAGGGRRRAHASRPSRQRLVARARV